MTVSADPSVPTRADFSDDMRLSSEGDGDCDFLEKCGFQRRSEQEAGPPWVDRPLAWCCVGYGFLTRSVAVSVPGLTNSSPEYLIVTVYGVDEAGSFFFVSVTTA